LVVNAFSLFGVAPEFAIDASNLAARYRDLQATVHPDRFVNATDADKRVAMSRTVDINEAYTTLKDPVRRAMHLLSLVGVDGLDEKNTSMPADFLMQQIDWREALADARLKEDEDRLQEMLSELESTLASLGDTFDAAYRGEHFAVATTLARKMRFMQKLAEEVDSVLAELDA
jgi:molecular chaperone HscB